ncbi:hypothetical protein BDV93DRAFT_17460 [Ceratobasidium sp. AG-I]|nr:hypothetical protein BDV93DRAFT_17460 [Ceratobasidium sp. AG-I]
MEDESNDFLGEVIDFGDGKTYTVPPEDEEHTTSPTLNKETRLGDDFDRSWPRSRPLHHEAEPTHSVVQAPQHSRFPPSHGLPPRHPAGDGRVLFNERSNRLEPARLQTSSHILAPGGPLHHHGPPPHANGPPRSAVRRNSALSSDRPKSGSVREPPPHSRDLPPHAVPGLSPELRARRPSDARSAHSPTERRSSFLHDERPRMGPFAPKGHEELGSTTHGLRRETSRDSRIGTGDRQPWSMNPQHPTHHRVVTDPLHPRDGPEPTRSVDVPAPASLDKPTHGLDSDAARKAHVSPSQQATVLPTSPLPHGSLSPEGPGPSGAPSLPLVPAALNEEREKFMKQAAERARRRKLEEEAAREEARERARKKAAELEALSKASLVTASPLVALTRQISNGYSSRAKSPVPKSPSVAPSVLPPSSVTSEAPSKPQATPDLASIASAVTSWRTKPKPEPSAVAIPPETLSPSSHVTPPTVRVEPDHSPQAPIPSMMTLGGGGMHAIEELHQVEGPLEVMDFSDMSKLAGRRTSITSASDLSRRKRPVASDFFDEAPSTQLVQRPNQGPSNYTHWNRDPR